MKIAVVHTLTEKHIQEFLARKMDAVICVRSDDQINASSALRVIYAYDDAPLINDYSFTYVSDTLGRIADRVAGVFHHKDYDLIHALEKDVFWGLLEDNAMRYQLNKYKSKEHRLYNYYSKPAYRKWAGLIKRLFIGKNNFYSFLLPPKPEEKLENFIAFRVNELELPHIYGNLFQKIKGRQVLSFQTIVQPNAEEIHNYLGNTFRYNFKSKLQARSKNSVSLKHKIQLAFVNEESNFMNVTVNCLFRLINDVDQYERLIAFGIKRFFISAGENEGEGNVICDVVRKHGGITYNYMNGAKAKEKINTHTHFDYWFMPNEVTQQLILSYCDVQLQQVPVIGHLLEEKAWDHSYSGTLDQFQKKLEGKKIIAFFTSIVFMKEQADVLTYLIDFLNKNEDWALVIKKHPADNRAGIVSHERAFTLPFYEGIQFHNSLYDLLSKAQLAISFSSTVSLQATWFKLLSINFEYAEHSVLPYIDNVKVLHINSIASLKKFIGQQISTKKEIITNSTRVSASEAIVKFMWPEKLNDNQKRNKI